MKQEIIEDSVKNGLIIKALITRILFVLKAAKIKPPKAALDTKDIMKFEGGMIRGV